MLFRICWQSYTLIQVGDFVNVRVTEASSATLKGEEVAAD